MPGPETYGKRRRRRVGVDVVRTLRPQTYRRDNGHELARPQSLDEVGLHPRDITDPTEAWHGLDVERRTIGP